MVTIFCVCLSIGKMPLLTKFQLIWSKTVHFRSQKPKWPFTDKNGVIFQANDTEAVLTFIGLVGPRYFKGANTITKSSSIPNFNQIGPLLTKWEHFEIHYCEARSVKVYYMKFCDWIWKFPYNFWWGRPISKIISLQSRQMIVEFFIGKTFNLKSTRKGSNGLGIQGKWVNFFRGSQFSNRCLKILTFFKCHQKPHLKRDKVSVLTWIFWPIKGQHKAVSK